MGSGWIIVRQMNFSSLYAGVRAMLRTATDVTKDAAKTVADLQAAFDFDFFLVTMWRKHSFLEPITIKIVCRKAFTVLKS